LGKPLHHRTKEQTQYANERGGGGNRGGGEKLQDAKGGEGDPGGLTETLPVERISEKETEGIGLEKTET